VSRVTNITSTRVTIYPPAHHFVQHISYRIFANLTATGVRTPGPPASYAPGLLAAATAISSCNCRSALAPIMRRYGTSVFLEYCFRGLSETTDDVLFLVTCVSLLVCDILTKKHTSRVFHVCSTSAPISASYRSARQSANAARPWIRASVSRDMPVYSRSKVARKRFQPSPWNFQIVLGSCRCIFGDKLGAKLCSVSNTVSCSTWPQLLSTQCNHRNMLLTIVVCQCRTRGGPALFCSDDILLYGVSQTSEGGIPNGI